MSPELFEWRVLPSPSPCRQGRSESLKWKKERFWKKNDDEKANKDFLPATLNLLLLLMALESAGIIMEAQGALSDTTRVRMSTLC